MTLNAISLVFATLVINIKKKGDRKRCPQVPGALLTLCKHVLSKVTCTSFLSFYEFYGYCPDDRASADAARANSLIPTDDRVRPAQMSRNGSDVTNIRKRLPDPHDRPSAASCVGDESQNQKKMSPVTLPPSPRDLRYEWFFVAEVVDKSLFLIFLLAMILTITMSLVVVPWLHQND